MLVQIQLGHGEDSIVDRLQASKVLHYILHIIKFRPSRGKSDASACTYTDGLKVAKELNLFDHRYAIPGYRYAVYRCMQTSHVFKHNVGNAHACMQYR